MGRCTKILALVVILVLLLSACTKATESVSTEPEVTVSSSAPADTSDTTAEKTNLEKSLEADEVVTILKAPDGQPLIFEGYEKEFGQRPDDPESLPETDPDHWYDFLNAGWSTEKTNIPESPADGSIGKKVIMVGHGEHPYYKAYNDAAKTVAELYGIELKIMLPNWDLNTQNQYIDQAINEKPDMIILLPMDPNASLQQLKKINEAGIPVIAAHTLAVEEALQYAICWTGPDEWAPRIELAKLLAEKLGGQGGYCIMSHNPGGSSYFSRGIFYTANLMEIAPDMELLDLQSPGFVAETAKQLALDWIKQYGDELKAIIAADDGAQMVGILEACKQLGREDIVLIAAGNSKVGMDGVAAGDIMAINYESPAACGATAVKTAADWFNGKSLPSAIYLPPVIITQENVAEFYPAQW